MYTIMFGFQYLAFILGIVGVLGLFLLWIND